MKAPILADVSGGEIFGSVIGTLLFIAAAVISIYWLLLPFLMLGALKRIEQALKAIHAAPAKSDYETLTQLRMISTAQGSTVEELRASNERTERTNQLLEWLGELQQQRRAAEEEAGV